MNKKLKYLFACPFLIITFLTIKTLIKKAKPEKTLTIGMMSGWAPFMTINSEGNYEGFDVDLAQEIGKQLKINIEIKDMGTLSATFIAMEQGKIDCIMSGLDITKARLDKMQMIPYTGETIKSFSMIFWNKIPTNIKTIYDFKTYPNATICVEPGSSIEKFLDQFNFINQKAFSKTEEMILDIKYNKC